MVSFPNQRMARIGMAVLLVIIVCVSYRLGTIQHNMNSLRRFGVKAAEKPSPEGFLVWGPNCQIADMDPFDRSIRNYLRPAERVVCSRLAPLTYTTRVADRQVLKVDQGVVPQYLSIPRNLICCLSVVTRLSENKNNVSLCVDFIDEVELNMSDEYLLVRCRNKRTGKRLYINMHAVVQVKMSSPTATVSPPEEGSTPSPAPRRLNVLLMGIDSMSRLNMLRTMPRTVNYLRNNDWLELRGYNKIGENTFPNLMAVLTGWSAEQLKHVNNGCWPTKTFDQCQFIWKQFKQKGYITAYAEDEHDINTFNYHKGGFINPPTDHYFRPFMLAATHQLPIKKADGLSVCLGPTATSEHFLRFVIDLTTTYKTSPFFALIWLNNFSHNNYNNPAAMDNRFETFFHQLSATGTLNTTIIVFFSDHGSRYGEIRQTYMGWLEERLPFFYVRVPSWFKTVYPQHYKNLKENGNRLTSPYDLHLTLKDIVMGLENVGSTSNGSGGCSSCASLFTPLPQGRGCKDAGIAPHWCTCGAQAKTPISGDVVQRATKFVISEIWTKLSHAGNISKNCAQLELKQILDARLKIKNEVSKYFDDYVVIFETQPAGQFDATVRFWQGSSNPRFELLGTISRIDSYGKLSNCMKNAELKLYCVCIDSL